MNHKKLNVNWFVILLMLISITLMHYVTSMYKIELHEFYRRLYYIPIILSSFKFKLRGGVITPLLAALLYAPHLIFYMGELNIHIVNQFLEIFLFFVVGVTTGVLVQQQEDQSIELIKLEDQLNKSQRLSMLGELASSLAHEIRNPLGIINATSQTLRYELEENQDAIEGLKIIEEEVQRANLVIQGLLDIARPAENNFIDINLYDLLKSIEGLMKRYAKQYKTILDLQSPENKVVISGDWEKLKQAFINIILNGIQAMPKGGRIVINILTKADHIEVALSDNGVGIEPNSIERVFSPFYTTKAQGTGLGLSITRRIIHEHGGQINLKSSKGIGTEVNVILPKKAH